MRRSFTPAAPAEPLANPPKALTVYEGSDGKLTASYYATLELRGPIGIVALNLFRAQKCSARAKVYRGGIRGQGSFKSMAYDRKSWSMQNLCSALQQHSEALNISWGWKKDPKTVFGMEASWVLYVELPQGQVSFHSPTRGAGPDYPGDWDGQKLSAERIVQFCDAVMAIEPLQSAAKDAANGREEQPSSSGKAENRV